MLGSSARRRWRSSFVLVLMLGSLLTSVSAVAQTPPAASVATPPSIDITKNPALATMSNGFVSNDGQLPPSVQFEADLGTGMLHLFDDGFNLNLPNVEWERPDQSNQHTKRPQISKRGNPHDVRVAFVGSNRTPQLVARDRLTATLSDYRGDDQSKWRRDLSQYASVSYHDLYPNIMLDYTLDTTGGFKSTYVVAPHGDPTLIRWRYQGVQDVSVAPDGSLVLTLPPRAGFATRTLTESAPLAWQDMNGDRVFVPVRFVVSQGKQVSFRVGQYDSALPLVIDPTMTVGYTQTGVYFEDVAAHPDGSFYVVGYTTNTTKLWHLNANGSVTDVRSFGYSYDYATAIAIGGDGTIATISGTAGTGTPMHPTVNEDVLVTMWVANGTPSTTRIHMGGDLSGYMYLEMQRTSQRIVVSYFGIEYTPTGGIGHNYIATLVNGSLTSIEELASNADVVGVDSTGATLITLSGNLVRRPIGGSWQTIATLGSVVAWNLDQTTDIVTIVDTQNSTGSGFVRLRSYTNTGGVRWSYTLPANEPYNPFSDVAMLSDGSVLAVGWSDSTSLPIAGSTTVINPNERGIYWAKIAANGSGITASDMVYPAINYYWFDVAVAVNAVDTAMLGIYTQNGNNSSRASYVATLDFGVGSQTLPTAPKHTTSYYMGTTEWARSAKLGCFARKNREQGIVVLNYGSARNINGTWGVGLKVDGGDVPPAATVDQVLESAKAFAGGYYSPSTCSFFYGISIPNPSTADLTIALGTTNSYVIDANKNPVVNTAFVPAHARAWGTMVKSFRTYLYTKGYKGLQVGGALDAEPGWWELVNQTAQPTKDWVLGYADIYDVPPYYSFSSIDGGEKTSNWGTYNQRFEDVYDIAQRLPRARPLPQIYSWMYAKEWYQLKRYVRTNNKGGIFYNALMTDCGSTPAEKCTINEPTLWPDVSPYSDSFGELEDPMSPTQGWTAFYDTLNFSYKNAATLPSNWQLSANLRIPHGVSVTVGTTTYTQYDIIPQLTAIPAGTTFPKDMTFSRYTLPPQPNAPYETMTAVDDLPFLTDITYESYSR